MDQTTKLSGNTEVEKAVSAQAHCAQVCFLPEYYWGLFRGEDVLAGRVRLG